MSSVNLVAEGADSRIIVARAEPYHRLLGLGEPHVHHVIDHWPFDDNDGRWTADGGVVGSVNPLGAIVAGTTPGHPHNKSLRLEFVHSATSARIAAPFTQFVSPGVTASRYEPYTAGGEVYLIVRLRSNVQDLRMEFCPVDGTQPGASQALFSRFVEHTGPVDQYSTYVLAVGSGTNSNDPFLTPAAKHWSFIEQLVDWGIVFKPTHNPKFQSGDYVEIDYLTVSPNVHPDLTRDH